MEIAIAVDSYNPKNTLHMAMLANTLRILEAANFEPRQAAALAEAIDGEVHASQPVTVPVLDARMMAIDARFEQVDTRFEQVDTRFAQIDTRFAQVDARFAQVDVRFAQIDARFAQVDARFSEVKFQIAQSEAKLTNRMIGFGFAAVSLIVTTVFFIMQHFR